MPILCSSILKANKDRMSKNGQMKIQLSDWVENIVGKEKLLVISNFSLSQNVFKSCPLLMYQNEYLWNKGLSSDNLLCACWSCTIMAAIESEVARIFSHSFNVCLCLKFIKVCLCITLTNEVQHDQPIFRKSNLHFLTTNNPSVYSCIKVGSFYLYFNPLPNKLWLLCVSSSGLLKTLWEKEKWLSFSHCVFYPFEELKFLPFSTNLKLLSANCLSFGSLKICCMGNGKKLFNLSSKEFYKGPFK